ncbi:MAG: 30S ribosomal protein S6 [Chloroflexi bacterium]|nr:30S ribosomal protein S6 [Chloroflexota bacterium]
MRSYELVLVINPDLPDENIQATIDKVTGFITEKGGAVTTVDQWGKRKLAYPIKHFTLGHYVLTQFSLEPKLTTELEGGLQISEDVLRHLLVKLED